MGRATGRPNYYAHRLAFALANDRVEEDLRVVMHSCDNPACCNPAHLSEGTQADNVRDAVAKGRARNGTGGYDKKYCIHGHARTDDNIYRTPSGRRDCRVCLRAAQARARARRAALVAP